jgi:hypothetical protein
MKANKHLAALVRSILFEALQELIPNKNITASLFGIDFQSRENHLTGRNTTVVTLRLRTNNRPVVVGTFGGLSVNGLYGLGTEYVRGYLRSATSKNYPDLEFNVDVHPTTNREFDSSDLKAIETTGICG